jgi:hypothetical protein
MATGSHREEQHLLPVGTAISDGAAVDWEALEASSSTDEERSFVEEMRVVDGIARFFRAAADPEATSGQGAAGAGARVRFEVQPVPGQERLGELRDRGAAQRRGVWRGHCARDTDLDREVALCSCGRPPERVPAGPKRSSPRGG